MKMSLKFLAFLSLLVLIHAEPNQTSGTIGVDSYIHSEGVISPEIKLEVPKGRAFGNSMIEFYLEKLKATFTDDVLHSAYTNFTERFGKPLVPNRKPIFMQNILSVFKHNFMLSYNNNLYRTGLNLHSDLTADEVRQRYTGGMGHTNLPLGRTISPTLRPQPNITGRFMSSYGSFTAPEEKDWRKFGIVTSPKYQGECNSCTFFALTGAMESALALYQNQRNLDLSEQQLLDCTTGSGIFRCGGNWPEDIYNYQMTTGQVTEESYSYTGTVGTCKTTTPVVGKLKSFFRTPQEDENTLKEWIGLYGVASGVIQVDDLFISYHDGIYNTPCNNTRFDHSILIVGYGKDADSNQDYWIVKNSWGTSWGEGGFFRLARNDRNLCRIASYAFLPQA